MDEPRPSRSSARPAVGQLGCRFLALVSGNASGSLSFPSRNYEIAPADAWSRLIEAQGFGQRFVDAHGNTLGTIGIRANQISRFITITVPKAQLGQPVPAGRSRSCSLDRTGPVSRPGALVHLDAWRIHVRRLRHRQRGPALHGRAEHGAQGAPPRRTVLDMGNGATCRLDADAPSRNTAGSRGSRGALRGATRCHRRSAGRPRGLRGHA
jgi:hypothetical protein